MRLRPGALFYQKRNIPELNPDEDGVCHAITVRLRSTNELGVVTRVCPSGNHVPPQAHVVFGGMFDSGAELRELWVPLKDLVHT